MKRTVCLTIAVLSLACACYAADATTIKAELEKTAVTADETVTYKVTVVSSEQRIPAPVFPGFKGLGILSSAQSSSISFDGKGTKTMMVFVFVLLPDGPGQVLIPPSSIDIGGSTISTQEFVLQVTPGSAPQRDPGQVPRRALPPGLGGQPRYEI